MPFTAERGQIVYEVHRQDGFAQVLYLEFVTMKLYMDAACSQPVDGEVLYLGEHKVELQNGKLTGLYQAEINAQAVNRKTFKKNGPKDGAH